MLLELDKLQETLDREEFAESVQNLYESLTMPDKKKLLKFNHKAVQAKEEKHSFNPEISKASR